MMLLLTQCRNDNLAVAQHTEYSNCSLNAYTASLLDIMRDGLPTTTDPKHVVIIGAGIAGLTSAKLLKDAGHQVFLHVGFALASFKRNVFFFFFFF